MIDIQGSRLLVIHEVLNYNYINNIQNNDMLFFDDCLYSQYICIKKYNLLFIEKNVKCVLGFSTGIYRNETQQPMFNAICSECHDKIHNNIDVTNAYMSLTELRELLSFNNVYLAAHGHMHLKLESVNSNIQRVQKFIIDCTQMFNKLKDYNLYTDIYVFPYAFDDIIGCYNFLKKHGIKQFFAGKNTKRIEIERLQNNCTIL